MDCINPMMTCSLTISLFFLMFIYINKKQNYEYYLKDPSKEPTSCDDFKYGCCEIYPTCLFEKGDRENIHVESFTLDFKVAFKYNEKGTNCPRIKHIVNVFNALDYESAYELINYNNGCLEKNSIYTCCSIDYMCDERYYEDYIIQPTLHEGDYQTIYNKIYNGTEILILNKNEDNSECPNIKDIVDVYQNVMLKRKSDIPLIYIFITINAIILTIILTITIYNSCPCIYCKKQEHHKIQQESV